MFTEMTRCHGYMVAKAMAVEVDTDKYYFERILIVYNSSTFAVISALLARRVICGARIL